MNGWQKVHFESQMTVVNDSKGCKTAANGGNEIWQLDVSAVTAVTSPFASSHTEAIICKFLPPDQWRIHGLVTPPVNSAGFPGVGAEYLVFYRSCHSQGAIFMALFMYTDPGASLKCK